MRKFPQGGTWVATLLAAEIIVGMVPGSVAADSVPPEPQLIKDAWIFQTFFEADPEAIKAVLPPGLKPDPSNTVMVNMYTVPDASQTSGIGAYTLTYMTIQVQGHDGYIQGSTDPMPGLYFAHYWNSSEPMRAYTSRAGIPNEVGGLTTVQRDANKVSAKLTVNGKPFIEASSDLTGDLGPAGGGHTNYLAGKGSQVTKLPLPWVCRDGKTDNAKITFNMPPDHPAYKLRPKKVLFSLNMQCTFTYPQAVTLKP
jgi:Acetoacetate decarboxylase (ADC)